MEIKIILGDITLSNSDAIVNAANKELRGGSGVCGAIFKKAGWDELQKECYEKGPIKTGEAIATKGYNLKAKYIIHAVGPIYHSDLDAILLKSAYTNSLRVAEELNLKSIAFPSISTGVYGYPKEKACLIALDAIKEYNYKSIEIVELYCFDLDSYNLYKKNTEI